MIDKEHEGTAKLLEVFYMFFFTVFHAATHIQWHF